MDSCIDGRAGCGIEPDNVQGAFLGAAIGDALGWPQERRAARRRPLPRLKAARVAFESWFWRGGGRFNSYAERIEPGEYSDDTQLLLATARCLRYGKRWQEAFYYQELPIWLLYERGGGSATKAAAEAWAQGKPPWLVLGAPQGAKDVKYFEAGGNGAAMRILPHAVVGGRTREEMQHDVLVNAIATHGHPRALVGALLYADAAWLACRLARPLPYGVLVDSLLEVADSWHEACRWLTEISGWWEAANAAHVGRYERIWSETVSEATAQLRLIKRELAKGLLANTSEVLASIGCFDKAVRGSGVVTAVAAVYLCAQYAADPVTGLLEAAYADGADTDTIASMLGGLLGLIHGTSWLLPEWSAVQDEAYIKRLASATATGSDVLGDTAPLKRWTKKHNQAVVEALRAGRHEQLELGALGRVQVCAGPRASQGKAVTVTSWKVVSQEGQTLYIRYVDRLQPRQAEPQGPETARSRQVTPIHIASLLGELGNCFPPGVDSGEALRFVAILINRLEDQRRALGEPVLAARMKNQKLARELVSPVLTYLPTGLDHDRALEIAGRIASFLYSRQ